MGGMGRLPENTSANDRKTYPLRKKATTPKEPEWTLRLEEWGTRKEIDDIEYAHKERSSPKQEISRREQQLRLQQRRRQKLEIILVWETHQDISKKTEGGYSMHHIISSTWTDRRGPTALREGNSIQTYLLETM